MRNFINIVEATVSGNSSTKLTETRYTAYHGTGSKIDSFRDQSISPNYFTTDREYALAYVGKRKPALLGDRRKKTRNYLLTVEIEIKNMMDTATDSEALKFYNEKFVPAINALHARYNQPMVPELSSGKHISFVYADHLWRYVKRLEVDGISCPYDGMLVDEGINGVLAIVPFNSDQIKIKKRETVKITENLRDYLRIVESEEPVNIAGLRKKISPELMRELEEVMKNVPPRWMENGQEVWGINLNNVSYMVTHRGWTEDDIRDLINRYRELSIKHGWNSPHVESSHFNDMQKNVLGDMLQRAPGDFIEWLQDYCEDEAMDIQSNPEKIMESFSEWLDGERSVRVREDGLIEFWKLESDVRNMIGENAVALFHYTSSVALPSIHQHGLVGDRKSVNYRQADGVYLTTERSGPAVVGYGRNAVAKLGRRKNAHAVMLTIKITLDQLQEDDDDADITSGAHQFVTDFVPPEWIISAEAVSL